MKIIVIGGGIAGLAAASVLAKEGKTVQLLEKTDQIGGRARVWKKHGFTFDMGPSWYMTPQFFERYLTIFNKRPQDYYSLEKLDPAYSINVDGKWYSFSTDKKKLKKQFEKIEIGSYKNFNKLMAAAKKKYRITDRKLLFNTFTGIKWVFDLEMWKLLFTGGLFHSYHSEIKRYIKNPVLQSALEFFTIFLGGSQYNMPAIYTQLLEMVFGQHIWYPIGGFGQVTAGFKKLAQDQGVKISLNSPVEKIHVKNNKVEAVQVHGKKIICDAVLSATEVYHTEQLLDTKYQQFSSKYWNNKVLSPATLLIFLGLNKRLKNVAHHNIVFHNTKQHLKSVFDKQPEWPKEVSYYVSIPSISDRSIAPKGGETLMLLVPLSPNLKASESENQVLAQSVIDDFQKLINQRFDDNMVVKKVVAHKHFSETFNAYKGGAFGLANTFWQTAFLRPPIISSKVKNLFFAGHYTLPGVGFPTSLISGEIAAKFINKKN